MIPPIDQTTPKQQFRLDKLLLQDFIFIVVREVNGQKSNNKKKQNWLRRNLGDKERFSKMMHAIHFPNKKAVGQAAAGKVKKVAVPNGKVKVTKSTGSSSNAKAGSKKPKPKSSKKATDAKKKRKAKVNVTPPPVNGR